MSAKPHPNPLLLGEGAEEGMKEAGSKNPAYESG